MREELFAVLLRLLVRDPFRLLPVGGDLEGQAEEEERQAEDVGEVGCRRQRGEGGCRQREGGAREGVDEDDGEGAEGDPGCLGEEGDVELGGGGADLVEAGVFAVVGGDALEEVGSHCLELVLHLIVVKKGGFLHLVAQMPTAALRTACLHHQTPCPRPFELRYSTRPPAAAPAC